MPATRVPGSYRVQKKKKRKLTSFFARGDILQFIASVPSNSVLTEVEEMLRRKIYAAIRRVRLSVACCRFYQMQMFWLHLVSARDPSWRLRWGGSQWTNLVMTPLTSVVGPETRC